MNMYSHAYSLILGSHQFCMNNGWLRPAPLDVGKQLAQGLWMVVIIFICFSCIPLRILATTVLMGRYEHNSHSAEYRPTKQEMNARMTCVQVEQQPYNSPRYTYVRPSHSNVAVCASKIWCRKRDPLNGLLCRCQVPKCCFVQSEWREECHCASCP